MGNAGIRARVRTFAPTARMEKADVDTKGDDVRGLRFAELTSRLVLFLALATWAGAANAATEGEAASRQINVPYTLFTLDNGLTVIVHTDRSTPRVSVNAWYHVGSGREKPGRTGFAHLFEHIMFEGSANVPEGKFDEWLEAAGAGNNGSTTEDRTNYYEDGPVNSLDLALFLESDRMGHLLGSMGPEKVNGQRDVVKNERRQSYENRPYGMADLAIPGLLFPDGHPYSWPVIGSMEDLSAAAYQDVVDFFKRYYGPGNASLVIAGDVDVATVRAATEKWFADVPASEPLPPLEQIQY